jgi:hypothetical protein
MLHALSRKWRCDRRQVNKTTEAADEDAGQHPSVSAIHIHYGFFEGTRHWSSRLFVVEATCKEVANALLV